MVAIVSVGDNRLVDMSGAQRRGAHLVVQRLPVASVYGRKRTPAVIGCRRPPPSRRRTVRLVLSSHGAGSLTAASVILDFPAVLQTPEQVFAGDVTGDGVADVVGSGFDTTGELLFASYGPASA